MMGLLVSALDCVSPRARRAVAAMAALLAVFAAMAALVLTPSPPGGGHARRAIPQPQAGRTPTRLSRRRVLGPVSGAELGRARQAAERFLEGYLSFAYGRAHAVVGVLITPALRRQLVLERAQITPVERRRHAHVESLQVVGMAPGFALATATVDDGGITVYQLRFSLAADAGLWAVSSVQGG